MKTPGKITTILILFMMIGISGYSQKYLTKNGEIRLYSETPLETINPENKQVNAALDIQTGDFVFKVLMKSFVFEKALMQEHFNENYVESDKFPNATFQGKVTNIKSIDFTKPGSYDVQVEGDLTIHGVTRKISEKGNFTVESGDKIHGTSKFLVIPADYDIKIPSAVMGKIAESIEVNVDIELSRI
jgi:polyisoprenoid-binding protein YceI